MNNKQRIALICLTIVAPTHTAMWEVPHNIKVSVKPGNTTLIAPHAQFDMAFKAFNSNKTQVELNELVFGKANVHVSDVFLVSNLARAGKLTLAGSGDFVSFLSTMTLDMNLDQKHFSCALEGSISGSPFDSDTLVSLDVSVPFEYYEHNIAAQYLSAGIAGNPASGTATDPTVFFSRFSGVEEFVEREILTPKGLRLLHTQRSFGIGSMRFAGLIDLSSNWDNAVKKMQIGFVSHIKAPQGDLSNIIWPAARGLGGHYFGATTDIQLDVSQIFKPFLRIEAITSMYDKQNMRIPQLKAGSSGAISSTTNNVLSGSDLSTLNVSSAFSQYDSTIPFFADASISVDRRRGTIATFQIGNAMAINDSCEFSFWYTLRHKSKDAIKANKTTPAGTFNYDVMTARTNNLAHIIGWQTMYHIQEQTMLSFGAHSVVKGENTPQHHSLYVRIEGNF